MRRFQSYIICTSPRSGSTMLCRLLCDTGIAGHPGSHFHEPSIEKWLEYYDLRGIKFADEHAKLVAIFEAAVAYGKGRSDIFSLRLQWDSLCYFIQKLNTLRPTEQTAQARLDAAFGSTLLIHLTRRDKLAQAISCVKARQTGLWHKRADGSELERLSSHQDPLYDRGAIGAQLAEFQANDLAWENWFKAERLPPLRLTYEDLSMDTTNTAAKVLKALGLDQGAARNLTPTVAKLSDDTNRHWAERYVAEESDDQ